MAGSIARRATTCEYLNQVETNLRLTLKAQAQCARTVEVLAAMKNPPIVFAKQANIAHGHQQVNNSVQPATHAGKTINSSNELLSEANHAHWTPEERLKQSKLIKNWKPWKQAMGARTTEGKAKSSQNAYKHGLSKLKKEMS